MGFTKTVQIVENDLADEITVDWEATNVTGLTIQMNVGKNPVISRPAIIDDIGDEDPAANRPAKLRFEWQAGDLTPPGTFAAEVETIDVLSKSKTIAQFKIKIVPEVA